MSRICNIITIFLIYNRIRSKRPVQRMLCKDQPNAHKLFQNFPVLFSARVSFFRKISMILRVCEVYANTVGYYDGDGNKQIKNRAANLLKIPS